MLLSTSSTNETMIFLIMKNEEIYHVITLYVGIAACLTRLLLQVHDPDVRVLSFEETVEHIWFQDIDLYDDVS